MKCNICDHDLTEKETIYSEELKGYEPCTTCLDVAMEAAYSDGFQAEDDEYLLIDGEENDTFVPHPWSFTDGHSDEW